MCGIVGLHSFEGSSEDLTKTLASMTRSLSHRGPDDDGVWIDPNARLGLGHRRLSILDLSAAGAQPMHSASQRYVIAFNGEVYNHLDLRHELKHSEWRGHSDTETVLAAIDCWGLESTLPKLVGMFAIALWDRKLNQLTLARDRCGEKPLYYGWCGRTFSFASELKAFESLSGWDREVDRDALALFLRYGYVPAPWSIWRNIKKLPPGMFVTVSGKKIDNKLPEPTPYWRASTVASATVVKLLYERTALDELSTTLRASISRQLVADVPVGAFLSGGVDSSLVVALMQQESTDPIHTFTVGFNQPGYNEARYAKAVAQHLGTRHTELYLGNADALELVPSLATIYDEPFGDSSQIPTYLVSKLARQHVSVCLTGDGGDEVFGGYNRYVWAPAIWRQVRVWPRSFRLALARLITTVPSGLVESIVVRGKGDLTTSRIQDRVLKFSRLLEATGEADLYQRLISQNDDAESMVLGLEGTSPRTWAGREASSFSSNSEAETFVERMMFNDLVGYLPDDILTKVDRASMANGLETRLPFLDHSLVEFSWQLPMQMKIRHRQGKWLPRQLLYQYVPRHLIERPKQGFAVPLACWLRGPLRDWGESLLNESRLSQEGYLKPSPVVQRWREHLSGRRNWEHWLWNVLMFQAWRERWA